MSVDTSINQHIKLIEIQLMGDGVKKLLHIENSDSSQLSNNILKLISDVIISRFPPLRFSENIIRDLGIDIISNDIINILKNINFNGYIQVLSNSQVIGTCCFRISNINTFGTLKISSVNNIILDYCLNILTSYPNEIYDLIKTKNKNLKIMEIGPVVVKPIYTNRGICTEMIEQCINQQCDILVCLSTNHFLNLCLKSLGFKNISSSQYPQININDNRRIDLEVIYPHTHIEVFYYLNDKH